MATPAHLGSATAAVFLDYFKQKNLSLGPLLFSTAQGDEFKSFREKIAGKGVTITVFEVTANGTPTVLAGTASCWLNPNGDVYFKDPCAVLFDDKQAHFPADAQWATRFIGDWGPIWGHSCLLSGQLSQNSFAQFSTVGHADYPTWTAKATPLVAQHMYIYQVVAAPFKMNADFAHLTTTAFPAAVEEELGGAASTTIGVCAVAGSGKSTLLNACVSVVKGRTIAPFNAGGGAGTEGQRTTAAQHCGLFEEGGHPHPHGKEIFLRDTVGTEQIDCLMHHLKAILQPGEAYDRTKIATYAQRRPSAMEAGHTILLLIPQDVLTGPEIDDKTIRFFTALRELAAQYDANKDGMKYQLTIIPVITKVDQWCAHASRRITDRSCLLARSQGPLKALFDKLSEAPFHFQPRNAYAIGWLDDDVFSYRDENEPVVLALKQILCVATQTGSSFVRRNKLQ